MQNVHVADMKHLTPLEAVEEALEAAWTVKVERTHASCHTVGVEGDVKDSISLKIGRSAKRNARRLVATGGSAAPPAMC
jgi:hypothetical protein